MSNLFNQVTGNPVEPTEAEAPAWLLAGDMHNIGNQGSSWFEPSTWGDKAENGLKFAAVSIISGGAQLFNTGVAIGNLAGANIAETTIQETVDSVGGALDSNLGEYYSKNRESADLVGFIASSLIPGIGGIKVLNAGQNVLRGAISSGLIGGNLAKATGLLVPKTATYITAAAQDINAASATFSAITQNGIKALASGAGQQVLEGIAFETMVQATMFKSPILSEQSSGDIVKNIFTAGILGGVIGGAFEGAMTYGKIMKQVKGYELATKEQTARVLQQEMSRPDVNVIRNAYDLDQIRTLPAPLPNATVEELALYNNSVKNLEQRTVRILNDMRSDTNALAKGSDNSATNMIADALTGQKADRVMEALLHADEIVRPGVMTQVEKDMAKLVKDGKLVTPEYQVNHVKLTGEGAGLVTEGEPLVKSLADTVAVRAGQSIQDAVLAEVKSYKFRLTALYDATKATGKTAHTVAEARQIWLGGLEKLPDSLNVHMNDVHILEKAYKLGKLDVNLVDNTGQVVQKGFTSGDELKNYLIKTKHGVAEDLISQRVFKRAGAEVEDDLLVQEEIAKIVNAKQTALDKSVLRNPDDDYFAWQSANKEYEAGKIAKGLPTTTSAGVDTRFLPTYAKVSRRVPEAMWEDMNGNIMDGMTWIKSQEAIHQAAVDNVVAKATGELYSSIQSISEEQVWKANRGGAGAKLAGFATGGYGSLESVVQGLGAVTQKLKTVFRQTTSDTLQGPLASLGKNQAAAIEFSTFNQQVTRSGSLWVRHTEDGVEYAITKDVKAAMQKGEADGLKLADVSGDGDVFEFTNPEVATAVDAMIARSSKRQGAFSELRAAQGKMDAKDPDVYRPVRPNPKDYPHFAFVKDEKVRGQGHTTMIFASDASKLQQLGNSAEQAGFKVHYKADTEDYFKAYGDFEYQRTLNESYIDSELKNKGIMSEHFTKTDPQKIVNDIIQQHLREDDVLAMELMRAKNQKAFDFLEDQGKAYSRIEGSTLGRTSVQRLESSGKNPYLDYIKTALDVSKAPEAHLLYSFNKFLDESVSKAVGSIREVFGNAKTPYDADKINGMLKTYGMDTGYRDAALDLLVNHTAPKGELTKFVRAANSVMATLTLGLDPLNALVNAIGANVLRGTEIKQLTDAIAKGDENLAGKLATLAKIDVTGKGDMILAPAKLYAQAQKNFFEDGWKGGGPLMARYKQAGYVTGDAEKFHSILDDFALKGTETVADLDTRLNRAFATAKDLSAMGRKMTGNNLSEDYNRFISADVMRQLTDLAEEHKLLTRQESHAYINTFVNRVDGNIVASQRPLMFQGPIGNAIGLFQSYQFNMMQNLFRYSAEGGKKDVAMLMGLQGTFFGLNGLPGFQYINTHVVGTASGNTNHRDIYDATYGAAGKQMGDLLMYGLPSDLLRTNLYSRGDINPRSLTIIPTSIKDIPFVSGFTNVLSNIKDMTGKMANGASVWSTILQGVEHNGLSRPLAGFAQVMEAAGPGGRPFSTTTKGSILFSNDLVSLASVSRLAGGRPIDEAIVNDGVFRIHSYQQYDRDKMNQIAEAVKVSSIQGRIPDEEQVVQFAQEYARTGGKQQNFNKWMMNEMKAANTSQAQKITQQLQNPFAQKVQVLMGGSPFEQ